MVSFETITRSQPQIFSYLWHMHSSNSTSSMNGVNVRSWLKYRELLETRKFKSSPPYPLKEWAYLFNLKKHINNTFFVSLFSKRKKHFCLNHGTRFKIPLKLLLKRHVKILTQRPKYIRCIILYSLKKNEIQSVVIYLKCQCLNILVKFIYVGMYERRTWLVAMRGGLVAHVGREERGERDWDWIWISIIYGEILTILHKWGAKLKSNASPYPYNCAFSL